MKQLKDFWDDEEILRRQHQAGIRQRGHPGCGNGINGRLDGLRPAGHATVRVRSVRTDVRMWEPGGKQQEDNGGNAAQQEKFASSQAPEHQAVFSFLQTMVMSWQSPHFLIL